jgi:aminoglycoside phosphotransferase (APT) family kinase protein
MARETVGLVLLQQAGYPVPTMLLSEPNTVVLGKPFNLMQKLEGRNLWPVLAGVEPKQANELLNRFGALLAHLHRLDWRPFTPQADRYEANPAFLVSESIAASRQLYAQYGILGFLPVMDWLENQLGQIKVQPAVVHLDFHANNVFLCNDDRMVVIDWTQATVADYRTDLSWTLLIMGDFGQSQWGRQILQAYHLAMGKPVEDLAYFNVISYTKLLSSTLISLKTSPTELGLRPETTQSIRQQAPVFRALLRRIQRITGLLIPEMEAALR